MTLEAMDLSPIIVPLVGKKCNYIELDKETLIRGLSRPFNCDMK